jgi:hypothetical protein
VITAYGSTTDISSDLGPCVHSGYVTGLEILNADNGSVIGNEFGETINVNEAINDIFGEYSLIGTAGATCSCAGQFGGGGGSTVNVQPPVINQSGVVIYDQSGNTVTSIEIGMTGSLAIYGTGLAAGGYDLSPVVAVTNGVVITGLTYVSDEQVNVSYSATSATAGTASVTLTTYVATSSPASVPVGDTTPLVTGITQNGYRNSDFVVNVAVSTVIITGQHFGTAASCPTVKLPFSATFSQGPCSDTSIQFNGFTATSANSGYLTVYGAGYGGDSFEAAPGQSQTASASISAANFSLSMQGPLIYVSTGDTSDKIGVSANPANVSFSPAFPLVGTGNVNSSCTSSLSFPNPPTGQGTVYAPVTASGGASSCSGLFNLEATAYGAYSAQSQVVVPPQILIQMLYGEAHGQAVSGDTTSQLAIGVATQNRFSQTSYFSGVTTYQAAITPSQFNGISYSITNGPEPDLQDAGEVFASITGVSVANAACFFSTNAAGFTAIENAYNNPTQYPGYPVAQSDPHCYANTSYGAQIVWKTSIGLNVNGNGAPAFVFEQLRTSSTAPYVVKIP